MKNPFLTAVMQYNVYTENGAISHSTSGDALVDYFAKAGTYRDRLSDDVQADMSRIFNESPLIAMQILFYLRLITRSTKGFFASETVQRGQGVRDEYRKAMAWVARNRPVTFYKNMWLMPLVGSWKDLWHEDLLPVLDHEQVYKLIQQGIADAYNRDLIAKYLPKIRSAKHSYNARHQQLNEFAFGLCEYLGWTAKEYRLFKSSGKAHDFQRFMQDGLWDKLDFGRIAGKALFQFVNTRGRDGKTILERHGLEARMLAWLDTQPTAKFTGYVYELFKSMFPNGYNTTRLTLVQRHTINKQFNGLIELAKRNTGGIKGNVWCALDTSGSMTWEKLDNKGTTPYDICISLGVYFATLNEGAFHKNVIAFSDTSHVIQLSGDFTDMCLQAARSGGWGGTNFQSVIDEIVRVRQTRPDIAVEDFPQTLVVVSDMQFNPADGSTAQTNYDVAMAKLAAVGLPKMRIVWWWASGRGADFPSRLEDEGVAMISGFDGSILSLILSGESSTIDAKTGEHRQLNAYENMLKALQQDVLLQVKV